MIGGSAAFEVTGVEANITLKSDASVAVATASREGLRKGRHIEARQQLLQEKVRHGGIKIAKENSQDNAADALTSHARRHVILEHVDHTNQHPFQGMHDLSPPTACSRWTFAAYAARARFTGIASVSIQLDSSRTTT